MSEWDAAAAREAGAMRAYREHGVVPDFDAELETRIDTIGMYATIYLLEETRGYELPRAFHADPTVRRLKKLSGMIVGLGNDIFSCGKDRAEGQINLATTLARQAGVPLDEAVRRLVAMHNAAIEEFDALAASLTSRGGGDASLGWWLGDLRYASLGFTAWESQAPRYTAHKLVVGGRVITPSLALG